MIVILLPAYNEEASLRRLLPKLDGAMTASGNDYRVIVCDDGSLDATRSVLVEFASRMPLEIICHRLNRGLGETSRDLFERAAAISRPGDVIVRLDCDDTHEPRIIARMIEALDTQACDVVIASRFQPGGGQLGVGGYRAFISWCANRLMKVIFPVPGVTEFSCGFRAYRAEIIQHAIGFYGDHFIQLKGLGFTATVEKLVKLHLLGARFGEVPFVLRYDQKASESKMVSSITTLGYLVLTILYHWPWGGWRRTVNKRRRAASPAASTRG